MRSILNFHHSPASRGPWIPKVVLISSTAKKSQQIERRFCFKPLQGLTKSLRLQSPVVLQKFGTLVKMWAERIQWPQSPSMSVQSGNGFRWLVICQWIISEFYLLMMMMMMMMKVLWVWGNKDAWGRTEWISLLRPLSSIQFDMPPSSETSPAWHCPICEGHSGPWHKNCPLSFKAF